jgi:hypothetical protein
MADVSEHRANRNPRRLTSTEMVRYDEGKLAQNSTCGVFESSLVGRVQTLERIIALTSAMRIPRRNLSSYKDNCSSPLTARSCVASE